MLNFIRIYFRELLIGVFAFLAFVLFEALQQQFYTENFNNGIESELTFIDFFQGAITRWLLWLLTASMLVVLVARNPIRDDEDLLRKLPTYLALIVGFIGLNILLATALNLVRFGDSLTIFPELFRFYFFHKVPILFVFLIIVIFLFHFFRYRNELRHQVKELGALKYSNKQLYEQLRSQEKTLTEGSLILEAKVGNKSKILPVEEIYWIEADDYCARVHMLNSHHSIRASLKNLSDRLPSNFCRVHRKAIVNMHFINSFQWEESTVVLKNDQVIPMAQSRIKEVRQMVSTYTF